MSYMAPVLGAVLLLLLFRDVLITVFHPEGHGGLLFRLLSRSTWAVMRWGARRRNDGRHSLDLVMVGPLLAVLTPTLWVVVLIAGFAMIYWPWALELLDLPGELGPRWAEALYHSLNATSTLGLGDVRAELIWQRWLSGLHALAGFGLVTAALSYFMGVYRELPRLRTLAVDISNRLSGHDVMESIQDEDQADGWDQWIREVTRELIHMRHVFSQYPVLHYFRPLHDDTELLAQLQRLLDLRVDLGARQSPALERPAFQALDRAMAAYVSALHYQYVSRRSRPSASDHDDMAAVLARYRRVLRYFAVN